MGRVHHAGEVEGAGERNQLAVGGVERLAVMAATLLGFVPDGIPVLVADEV
tara:strand:- start:296 stop:448 length:153 start_codon:yes stop_codon:yes gene_type:complete